MNTYIKLDNNWFKGERYIKRVDKLSFAIYVLLQERCGYGNRCFITMSYLITHLDINSKARHYEPIRNALKELREQGLINFHENMYSDDILEVDTNKICKNDDLYISILEPIEKGFTTIYTNEIMAIMFCGSGTYNSRAGILSAFCYIISCINKKDKVCFPSIRDIQLKSNIGSAKTCKEHISKMVELELLVVGNPNVMLSNNGGVRQTVNVYGRTGDEEAVELFVEKKVLDLKRKPMSKYSGNITNKKRSLKQKINNIDARLASGEPVSELELRERDEMQEVYDQLCASTGTNPEMNYITRTTEYNIDDLKGLEVIHGESGKTLRIEEEVDISEPWEF